MIDQLIIGDRASFDDFAASVASRKIKMPKKKSIKETVPFSNITHDFSAIDGEVYWEERTLEYIFELTADDPEELEELKSKFAAWVMSVQGQELHDPHIPDYHFLATYEDMDPEDDEGLDKCTLTVTFTAYPYKIANTPKVYAFEFAMTTWTEFQILNESDHPVPLSVDSIDRLSMRIDGETVSLDPVEYKLAPGLHTVSLYSTIGPTRTVRLSFSEEVF